MQALVHSWSISLECSLGIYLWSVVLEYILGVRSWSISLESDLGVQSWSISSECGLGVQAAILSAQSRCTFLDSSVGTEPTSPASRVHVVLALLRAAPRHSRRRCPRYLCCCRHCRVCSVACYRSVVLAVACCAVKHVTTQRVK